jgi:hypothetical protein
MRLLLRQLNMSGFAIPAEAGIQAGAGCRIKSGMTALAYLDAGLIMADVTQWLKQMVCHQPEKSKSRVTFSNDGGLDEKERAVEREKRLVRPQHLVEPQKTEGPFEARQAA